ncbi:MAG: GNAT family N-acetyltransferase [Deltaproteobacteria bacterium]|nr:MAG: GNAT family N-acetyltransferase [Deltaproteobacteria bacterium]
MMIRRVTPADFKEILVIESEAFPKSRYDLGAFWSLFQQYPGTFLVVETDQVDGYIIFSPDGHIVSMAVKAQRRRRGVGSGLIRAALAHCADKVLRLEVRVSNLGARKFYERFGFKIKDRLERYYQDGEGALIMERPISRDVEMIEP